MSEDSVRVDEDLVKSWAEGTLQDWLTGYTHDPDHPQYKIEYVGEGTYRVSGTYPSTSDMFPVKFLVQVSVTEL